jgi:hypothetical protein
VCSAAAIVAFAALTLTGQPRAGISLAIGLALGGVNGLFAAKSVDVGSAFSLLSFARIGVLSALALGIGVLVQPATAWLTLIGVAASQFLMAGLAARSVLRR